MIELSRRDALAKGCLALLASRVCSVPLWAAGGQPIQLLRDPHFVLGANVYQTADTGPVITGKICPDPDDCTPAWNVAQWYSKFDLSHVKGEKLPSGSTRFRDEAKSVIFGRLGTMEADLILSLNARKEYGDKSPVGPHAWPHLYVQQPLVRLLKLSEVSELTFHVETKLLRSLAHHDKHWDSALHTAQFQVMFRVANINSGSPGYQDYLWFFVPIYDARYVQPVPMAMKDTGNAHKHSTDKFMYSPGGAAFTNTAASSHQWLEIHSDLYPLLNKALESGWQSGFLSGSHDTSDYGITLAVMGWEITGVIDSSMQIRNLSLMATPALGKG